MPEHFEIITIAVVKRCARMSPDKPRGTSEAWAV